MLTGALSAIILIISLAWMGYKLYAVKSNNKQAQRNVKKYNGVIR